MMAIDHGELEPTFNTGAALEGSAVTNGSTSGITAPYWVKLVRSGNTFTSYLSADGATWTQEGTTTIAMGTSVLIGLAVDSNNTGALNATTFDHVSLMTATGASLTPASGGSGSVNLLATATGPSGATLTVTGVTQGAYGTVVNNGDGTVTYTPSTPYARTDSFTYTISDGLGDTATGRSLWWMPVWTLIIHSPKAREPRVPTPPATGLRRRSREQHGRRGFAGGALAFNGSSSYATIPTLNLNSNTVTIAGWVNRNGSQSPLDRHGLLPLQQRIGDFTSARRMNCVTHGTVMPSTYGWNSGLTVPNGQWTFVALVITGSNGTIYMQPQGGAMQSATNAVANSPAAFDGVTDFGQDPTGGRFFNGSLDELRIYNTALSSSAISALSSDTPPTVATPAAASPNPVNDSRTNLSVLGASASGEPTLIYTWAATSVPSGASAPTFSANWNNAAKNTVVDFAAPGAYTLAATITDDCGLSVVSSVNVTVASAQLVWTGGGGNGNWSNAANWSGGWTPQAGDQLAITGTSTDDLSSGTVFTSINLQGSNTALGGNQITLVSGTNIAITSTGTNNSIGQAIQLGSNATISNANGTLSALAGRSITTAIH